MEALTLILNALRNFAIQHVYFFVYDLSGKSFLLRVKKKNQKKKRKKMHRLSFDCLFEIIKHLANDEISDFMSKKLFSNFKRFNKSFIIKSLVELYEDNVVHNCKKESTSPITQKSHVACEEVWKQLRREDISIADASIFYLLYGFSRT